MLHYIRYLRCRPIVRQVVSLLQADFEGWKKEKYSIDYALEQKNAIHLAKDTLKFEKIAIRAASSSQIQNLEEFEAKYVCFPEHANSSVYWGGGDSRSLILHKHEAKVLTYVVRKLHADREKRAHEKFRREQKLLADSAMKSMSTKKSTTVLK